MEKPKSDLGLLPDQSQRRELSKTLTGIRGLDEITRGGLPRQIIAAPTLIKQLPLPMRRIIGDMSNRERVLLGLDHVRSPQRVE